MVSGESNDLEIRSTSLLPTPFGNHVEIEDVKFINDRNLVGLFARDPGILGRVAKPKNHVEIDVKVIYHL